MDRAPPFHALYVRLDAFLAFGLALALLGGVSTASAEDAASTDLDRSSALFREGRELLARGALEEACRKFDASLELWRSPGTLLNIGNCRANAGDLLAAVEAYRSAIELAKQEPDAEKGQLWKAAGQKEIEKVEARLARLSVRVPPEVVAVSVDDRAVDARGAVILLNPGAHNVRASAPGKRTFELGIELSEGQQLALTVPPLGDDVPAGGPATPNASPTTRASAHPGAAPSPAGARDNAGFSWQLPLLLGGGALFATGAVFGILAARLVSGPDFDSASESDHARSQALVADVLMGGGLVAIGVGVAWPWIEPDPPPGARVQNGPRRAGLAGGCAGQACGVVLSGAF